ncbi:hypothetical protein [Desulfovibrio inopinatus]|uniref:hypothetical protein n=1 Tax=Desulfovibrio inopinatus TaxID=102109 RepID=UPI0004200A3D|nr:hypothetical protein [Desulfovibrio inopinatus]
MIGRKKKLPATQLAEELMEVVKHAIAFNYNFNRFDLTPTELKKAREEVIYLFAFSALEAIREAGHLDEFGKNALSTHFLDALRRYFQANLKSSYSVFSTRLTARLSDYGQLHGEHRSAILACRFASLCEAPCKPLFIDLGIMMHVTCFEEIHHLLTKRSVIVSTGKKL